ncbi:MAG: hypothetical protein N3A54_00800 [Patescibacteria group bacterium]|nr:hypothetical protein [Patescibacteria group bacterium]
MKELIQEYDINTIQQIFQPFFDSVKSKLDVGNVLETLLPKVHDFYRKMGNEILDETIDPKLFIKSNTLIYSISKMKEEINRVLASGSTSAKEEVLDIIYQFELNIVPAIFFISYFSYFKAWDFVKSKKALSDAELQRIRGFFSLSFGEIYDLSRIFIRKNNEFNNLVNEHFMSRKIKPIYDKGLKKIYKVTKYKECRFLGGDTRWCTASSSGATHVEQYTEWADLYIFFINNKKYHLALNKIFQQDVRVVAAYIVLSKLISEYSNRDFVDETLVKEQVPRKFLIDMFFKALRNKDFYKKEFLEEYLTSFAKGLKNHQITKNMLIYLSLILLERGNQQFMKFLDKFFKNSVLSETNFSPKKYIQNLNELANSDNKPIEHNEAFKPNEFDADSISDKSLFNYFSLIDNFQIFQSLTMNDYMKAFDVMKGRTESEMKKEYSLHSKLKLYLGDVKTKEEYIRKFYDQIKDDIENMDTELIFKIMKNVFVFNNVHNKQFTFLTIFNYDLINPSLVKEEMEKVTGGTFLHEIYNTILDTYFLFENDEPPLTFVSKKDSQSLFRVNPSRNLGKFLFIDEFNSDNTYFFLIDQRKEPPSLYLVDIQYNFSNSPEKNYVRFLQDTYEDSSYYQASKRLVKFAANVIVNHDDVVSSINNDFWKKAAINKERDLDWNLSYLLLGHSTLLGISIISYLYEFEISVKPFSNLNALLFREEYLEESFYYNWIKNIINDGKLLIEFLVWIRKISIFGKESTLSYQEEKLIGDFIFDVFPELNEYLKYIENLLDDPKNALTVLYKYLRSMKGEHSMLMELSEWIREKRALVSFFDYDYSKLPDDIDWKSFLVYFHIAVIKLTDRVLYGKFLDGVKKFHLTEEKRNEFINTLEEHSEMIMSSRIGSNSFQNKVLVELFEDLIKTFNSMGTIG